MHAKRCLPLLLAGLMAVGTALAADDADAPHAPRKAKALLGNGASVDVHAPAVGAGRHLAARPTDPGMYLTDKDRRAVREWFQSHPSPDRLAVNWAIGRPLPAGTPVKPVPAGLLGAIRKQPPGFRYLATGNSILLVANGSKLVVDSASAAQ